MTSTSIMPRYLHPNLAPAERSQGLRHLPKPISRLVAVGIAMLLYSSQVSAKAPQPEARPSVTEKQKANTPKLSGSQQNKRQALEPAYSQRVPRSEHFPLWFEMTGLGLGIAAMGSGVLLLSYDRKLNKDADTLYDNRAQGTGLLLAGVQVFAFSVVFLAIDGWWRSKKKQKKRTTAMTWQF